MIYLFYQTILHLVMPFILAKFAWERLVQRKIRPNLAQRFGFHFPKVKRGEGPVIWIHAVSLGETKAVAPLVQRLRTEYPGATLICSACTETGLAEGKKGMPEADHHVMMPFDLFWCMNSVMKKARPDLVLLCETDFWFTFLRTARRYGAKVCLVSGILSEKSMKGFRLLRPFATRLFSTVNTFCLQNELYEGRFALLGASADQMHVTGNLKFDQAPEPMDRQVLAAWRSELGIEMKQPVVTLGSTHDPEEKELLQVMKCVWQKKPEVKVLLVPRHPERFDRVAELLQKSGVSFVRYSEIEKSDGSEAVVLMDAMGKLRDCYQLSTVAIVAGSYGSKVGGHNILEPLDYGVPTLFGPHMEAQQELTDLVLAGEGGVQTTVEELPAVLLELIQDKAYCATVGEAGLRLREGLGGSVERTLMVLRGLIHEREEKKHKTSCA